MSNSAAPGELRKLATEAVALKARVDEGQRKKKLLRDLLIALQEALERRRAEEERLRREAEEEERRAAAAEAARLRAEEAARLATAAARQKLALVAAGGLFLGATTAVLVRSTRHHPFLDLALDAARRPLQHLWKAAAQGRAGRAALVAARRGLNCVSRGAAALGRGLGGVLLQAQSVGALDSDVRCVRATRLLEEAGRRAAPQAQRSMFSCSTIGCAALQGAVGGTALGGLIGFAAKSLSKSAKPKAVESEESKGEPEEVRAPEPEEEDADELMPDPTLRGVVSPPMAPFMARTETRPLPPAPRRMALPPPPVFAPVTPALPPPPPPVTVVTPESQEEPQAAEASECDEEPAEEPDAAVEVVLRPARRGYPEPAFEGLEALRARPTEYHELAAALASSGASIEGGERPLLVFRHDRISSARVASVTITANRNRNIEIDKDGDIAAQTAAAVREIKAATQALNPIKARLRAFEGQRVSVPGGRVSIGFSKEAVYGYALFVDRGVWNRLDEEAQDACVDAGIIVLKGAAAPSVALTVRDIGEAPPVPRKKKGAAPAPGKLSAVVRAKRGVTYYK
ncbi:unnamed protein product [Pelagomonas calceolata]|uniref:Uncharacterized protein n=2 Tax=Pelagomonas calceolata TaxID=35677 RepID=A0A8J2WQW6_9STRA|nr:unnamed protein product [Pelagomonas calceolata]|mmetsp:Transcript_9889/g.30790  ORF Transcript_9889/g.30790 Transcript_9889/m.30790 type:complete len:573 (+) Transcript_9889:236-1954(+)